MADQQIKEFEGLLENVEQVGANSRKNLKHYIKLILPHLLLVVAVCSYASVGAIVFHSIESPNEDALKTNGVERINRLRKELVEIMWEQRLQMQNIRANEMSPELLRMRDDWVSKIATKLQTFNENLYKAYKEEYVRYGDVRVTPQEQIKDPRLKRHRSSKSWTEKGGKMWTWSSALFFAATTMATIGYGNIVPVTVSGKIACIIFALIGAPLAIITIGDLGKFLSECTIWFYCKMQVYKKRIRKYWKMWKRRKAGVVVEYDQPDSPKSPTDPKSWEDELDKEDVPVLLVFVILLLYIAFGGVLFSVLESWTYVDAFYFSFVSLTTIGFGDLVPDRHEYIVIMLIYIGVGLAVTTMCIDLVGIQYIQKIHYFGRKFQNTDLLQLLKRKRLIERRLALGQGEEIIHIIQKMVDEEQKREPLPPLLPPLKSASQYWVNQVEEKYSLRSDSTAITPWNLPETIFEDGFSFFQAEPLLPPHLLSGPNSKRSSTISTPYTNSSSSARSIMYRAWGTNDRGGTSIESGPDISLRCSLSTPASVYEREFIFDNFRSPQPSVQSFKFSFPIEIDYKRIGDSARHSRRTNSAPSLIPSSPPRKGKSPPVLSAASSTSIGLACMESWDSYVRMLEESERTRAPPVSENKPVPQPNIPVFPLSRFVDLPFQPFERIQPSPEPEPEAMIIPEVEINFDVEPMFVESVEVPVPVFSRADFLEVMIPEEEADEDIISPVFPESSSGSDTLSPMFDIDLGAFELVDSGVTAEALLSADDPVIFHADMPVHSVHHDTVQTEAALENLMNAPSSMLSNVVPPTMVADNYCFVVDGDKVRMGDIMGDDQWWRHTSRPCKYFYSDDLKKFYRVNVITAKGKIISARLAGGPGIQTSPSSSAGPGSMTSSAYTVPGPSKPTSQFLTPQIASYPGTSVQSTVTTPRSSMCVGSTKGHRGEKVPLEHVYKVIRFYSFWRSCTSFHRIVTMIDTANSDDKNDNKSFKKRLFVQYLWRNAKPYEKARVQKEFDPRRQRLLRFVADSDDRKKKIKSMGPSTSFSGRRGDLGRGSGSRASSRASTSASREQKRGSRTPSITRRSPR